MGGQLLRGVDNCQDLFGRISGRYAGQDFVDVDALFQCHLQGESAIGIDVDNRVVDSHERIYSGSSIDQVDSLRDEVVIKLGGVEGQE